MMGGRGSGGQNKTSAETEAQLLEHVAKVPGLTAYQIGRALGMSARTTEVTLLRLSLAGRVQFETEPCPSSPSGERRLWHPGGWLAGQMVFDDLASSPGGA